MNSEIGIIESRDRRIDSLMESAKKYGPETTRTISEAFWIPETNSQLR